MNCVLLGCRSLGCVLLKKLNPFVQGKESPLQNCCRMYLMVAEYMHMNYFFTNFTYKTNESQGSYMNRLHLFLYVNIKRLFKSF